MSPPVCVTMPKTVARPRPVSAPASPLVVKNGSKIARPRVFGHTRASVTDHELDRRAASGTGLA